MFFSCLLHGSFLTLEAGNELVNSYRQKCAAERDSRSVEGKIGEQEWLVKATEMERMSRKGKGRQSDGRRGRECWNRVWCSFRSCESAPIEKSTSMWQPIEPWVIWVAILRSVYMELKGSSRQRSWREKMTNFSLISPFPDRLNCVWLWCVAGSGLRRGWLLRKMSQGRGT